MWDFVVSVLHKKQILSKKLLELKKILKEYLYFSRISLIDRKAFLRTMSIERLLTSLNSVNNYVQRKVKKFK